MPVFAKSLSAVVLFAFVASASPVKVIFDTDMFTDYDDVGAVAMLHAFADAGEAEILAMGTCSYGEGNRAAAACEVLNAYYGRPDVPLGAARSGGKSAPGGRGFGLAEKYPQWAKHLDSATLPDAVDVYRKALATAPDHGVTLVSVGFLNNVAGLLRADRSLVERKVKLWVCMACNYPNGKEYNSKTDAASSAYAFGNWPKSVSVVFTDFQYGRDCYSGRAVAELPDDGNPVRDVFAARLTPRGQVRHHYSWDQTAGHPSWDQTAVLIAVRGWEKYFNLERGAYRMVGSDGADEWVADVSSSGGRVTEKLPKVEVAKIVDELMCRKPTSEK